MKILKGTMGENKFLPLLKALARTGTKIRTVNNDESVPLTSASCNLPWELSK